MTAATSLVDAIDNVLESDDDDVVWVDRSDNAGPATHAARRRIDPAGIALGERSVVLTSATLPSGIVTSLGLPSSTEVVRVGSTFDYANQGLLYCARTFPSHGVPRPGRRSETRITDLIRAAGGRTFALFTSAAAMNEAADHFRDELDVPVLAQVSSPRPHSSRRSWPTLVRYWRPPCRSGRASTFPATPSPWSPSTHSVSRPDELVLQARAISPVPPPSASSTCPRRRSCWHKRRDA
ncbi:MAG: hypothetical protein R2710_18995 [Acidimicrobiales bacterium]